MKALLTSSGFETKAIEKAFIELIGKEPQNARVLFIPTAATYPDAVSVLPKCMNDLLKVGIQKHNINVFDLHCAPTFEECSYYDAIYFTGGDPDYLIKRINETGFDSVLREYVRNIGVYVGVSAGSLVAANNVQDNLGLLSCSISVHMKQGSSVGGVDKAICRHIDLSRDTAVVINGEVCRVIS